MTLALKDPYVIGPDGKLEARGVQDNFERIASAFPLAPNAGNFQRVPGARVYNSANLSIATGVDTALTFNSERWDYTPSGVSEQHSTSANTSRLTCRVAGDYLIVANVRFDANATGVRRAQVRYTAAGGGSAFIGFDGRPAASGAATDINVTADYRLAVGDYVEVVVFQNSGGALNVLTAANYSPEFSFRWMGP